MGLALPMVKTGLVAGGVRARLAAVKAPVVMVDAGFPAPSPPMPGPPRTTTRTTRSRSSAASRGAGGRSWSPRVTASGAWPMRSPRACACRRRSSVGANRPGRCLWSGGSPARHTSRPGCEPESGWQWAPLSDGQQRRRRRSRRVHPARARAGRQAAGEAGGALDCGRPDLCTVGDLYPPRRDRDVERRRSVVGLSAARVQVRRHRSGPRRPRNEATHPCPAASRGSPAKAGPMADDAKHHSRQRARPCWTRRIVGRRKCSLN